MTRTQVLWIIIIIMVLIWLFVVEIGLGAAGKTAMAILAIDGGKPEVKGPIMRYNSLGFNEMRSAASTVTAASLYGRSPLSGYLGGEQRGGPKVNALEDTWAERFKVKHAIAVNSATSGLLVAAQAVNLSPDHQFIVSPFTMSATVAAPMWTGAYPMFLDIESDTFGLAPLAPAYDAEVSAVFLTNLFGHNAHEGWWRGWCGQRGIPLIVDNAQSPFAMTDGHWSGTMGHIGVFSLNVHKHIQCGEGGICVTNDDELAQRMRMTRNHGEMADDVIGLNLRMTEVTAAIALAQLVRADELIAGRIALAEALTAAVKDLPGLTPPVVRDDCRHVYYCWVLKVTHNRDWFVKALQAEGVPIRAGYVDPLYRLPAFAAFARPCPVAERMHDHELALFEVCAHDPTPAQIEQIGAAFRKVHEQWMPVALEHEQ